MPELSQTQPQTHTAQRDASRLPHGEANLTPLAQLKRMQRVLYSFTQEVDVDKREAAQVALAWERLEARKAVLCDRPSSLTGKAEPKQRKRNGGGSRRPHDGPAPASLIVPTDAPKAQEAPTP